MQNELVLAVHYVGSHFADFSEIYETVLNGFKQVLKEGFLVK
jgi:hypothetical protein